VSEAWVWARGPGGSTEQTRVEAGRFQMRLAPGSYLVGALADRGDRASAPSSVEIESGETRHVELELRQARTVTVTVRQKGELVGCDLEALDEQGKQQMSNTSENGKFWVGPLVPGRYTLHARRDGKEIQRAFEVTAEGEAPKIEIVFE